MKGIRDVLFWFAANFVPRHEEQPRNFVAMDISFGSIGYSLILARPFVSVWLYNECDKKMSISCVGYIH